MEDRTEQNFQRIAKCCSHSRLNQKNDSFSIMGAKIWNSIPENLRNSSKSLFEEKVHTILLKIFEVQDRYADDNLRF